MVIDALIYIYIVFCIKKWLFFFFLQKKVMHIKPQTCWNMDVIDSYFCNKSQNLNIEKNYKKKELTISVYLRNIKRKKCGRYGMHFL
jgi:hypothetical protein